MLSFRRGGGSLHLSLSDSIIEKVKLLVTQLLLTLTPWTRTCPGSSVHGIMQARILEWVAAPFSKASSQTRNQNRISCTACGFFTIWATRKALSDSEVCPKDSPLQYLILTVALTENVFTKKGRFRWNLCGNSLVVQWLGLGTFTARGLGSIPDWGTKILLDFTNKSISYCM